MGSFVSLYFGFIFWGDRHGGLLSREVILYACPVRSSSEGSCCESVLWDHAVRLSCIVILRGCHLGSRGEVVMQGDAVKFSCGVICRH